MDILLHTYMYMHKCIMQIYKFIIIKYSIDFEYTIQLKIIIKK